MVRFLPGLGEVHPLGKAEILKTAAQFIVSRDSLQIGKQTQREKGGGVVAHRDGWSPALDGGHCCVAYADALCKQRGCDFHARENAIANVAVPAGRVMSSA